MSVFIRSMTLEDVSAVYDIEISAHITPWSKKILHDCVSVGYSCFVITNNETIEGFMVARGTKEQCHLLNLCVAPSCQGKGFGKALLLFLIDFVKTRCANIILEVRTSNKTAIALYHKHGFKQTGCKKKYYTDSDGTHEDAIVLELKF